MNRRPAPCLAARVRRPGEADQLTNAHPTAGTLAAYGYGYDVNHLAGGAMTMLGQRTSMTATVPSQSQNGAVTAYGYDNAYQLTQASYPTGPIFNGEVHNWTYDAIGNRLTSAVNGAVTSYTYQKLGTNPSNWQRLTNDGTNGYTYDANGNTITRAGDTYGWDYENRMTSISGSVAATYKYDYQGRRTSKTVAGVTTAYLYDGLNLLRESGSGTTEYVFGPGIDEPLALSGASGVSYLDVDALGSVMAANDPSGTSQNGYAYDAWGVPRVATETIAQSFRYTSREVGEVPHQWFYRARYYQSTVGRFLSEDPLVSGSARGSITELLRLASGNSSGKFQRSAATIRELGLRIATLDDNNSLYGYVAGRPLAFRDPTGELSECAKKAVGKFVMCGGLSFVAIDIPMSISLFACLGTGPAAPFCTVAVLGAYETVEVVAITICAADAYQWYKKCETCDGKK